MGKRDNLNESKKSDQIMSLEEAKAFRTSLIKNELKELSPKQKREAFKLFWAQNKKRYSKAEKLEEVLWLHLKAMQMDDPSRFQDGINHFGLKKVK